jgi:hypothetical protein
MKIGKIDKKDNKNKKWEMSSILIMSDEMIFYDEKINGFELGQIEFVKKKEISWL